MQLVGLDFETYWASDYTLSRMSTESYVRDPRFQAICVSIKIDDAPVKVYPRPEIERALHAIDWSRSALAAHNAKFDSFILAEHYGLYPARYIDTIAMGRCLGWQIYGGLSLGAMIKTANERGANLVSKGGDALEARGLRYEDFSPEHLARYMTYCGNDTDSTVGLFNWLMEREGFPTSELEAIHEIMQMGINARLCLDETLLLRRLAAYRKRKGTILEELGLSLKAIRSDQIFANKLLELGVDPPMKESPKQKNEDGTPKLVYAFSKTDDEFLELQEHDDYRVQMLVAARLKLKSTIEESRMERFLAVNERGPMPASYNYFGAHTGRVAAADGGLNLANMTRPVKPKHGDEGMLIKIGDDFPTIKLLNNKTNGKEPTRCLIEEDDKTYDLVVDKVPLYMAGLRDTIVAPPGHKLIAVDLSAIEYRTNNYIAGQMDVIDTLRYTDKNKSKEDAYTKFASVVYGRTITKDDFIERQVGKTSELQLGFLSGAAKLQKALKVQAKIEFDLPFCKNIVDLYRAKNDRIKKHWDNCKQVLMEALDGQATTIGVPIQLAVLPAQGSEPIRIVLPNGVCLRYPGLRTEEGRYGPEFKVLTTKGKNTFWKHLHPGHISENIASALARTIMVEQWVRIRKRLIREELVKLSPIVLHTYDEIVACVPEEIAKQVEMIMVEEMRKSPTWAPDLPVNCESGVSHRYGSC